MPPSKHTATAQELKQTKRLVGALIGKTLRIHMPQSTALVEYRENGEMHWENRDNKNGRTTQGVELYAYVQVSESLFFLNWVEKTGYTVSQLIDFNTATVSAFFSHEDTKASNGHRISQCVQGTLEIV